LASTSLFTVPFRQLSIFVFSVCFWFAIGFVFLQEVDIRIIPHYLERASSSIVSGKERGHKAFSWCNTRSFFLFLTINPNPNHPREHGRDSYIVRQREYFNCNNEHKEHHKHKNDILHILPFLLCASMGFDDKSSRTCCLIAACQNDAFTDDTASQKSSISI